MPALRVIDLSALPLVISGITKSMHDVEADGPSVSEVCVRIIDVELGSIPAPDDISAIFLAAPVDPDPAGPETGYGGTGQ